jgi:hypothetical protein
MADQITHRGETVRRANPKGKMTRGNGWRLITTRGKKRYFTGTLLYSHNFGQSRIAVFSVPKD